MASEKIHWLPRKSANSPSGPAFFDEKIRRFNQRPATFAPSSPAPPTTRRASMDPNIEVRKANCNKLKDVLRPILKHQGPYASESNLRAWNIKVSDLDLKTATSSDGGPTFISLFPAEKLDKFLDAAEPWEAKTLLTDEDMAEYLEDNDMVAEDCMDEAQELACLFEVWLCEGSDIYKPCVISQTEWNVCGYVFSTSIHTLKY
jgi:hypothetical protein